MKLNFLLTAILLASSNSYAGCFLDTAGNYVCDHGGNLGSGGYSYGELNGKNYNSHGYGDGRDTEIEFDNGQIFDCYDYGNGYECRAKN